MAKSKTAEYSLVHCPYCRCILANDRSLAGQLAVCPTCLNRFRMPDDSNVPLAQPVTPESLKLALPATVKLPQPVGQPQPPPLPKEEWELASSDDLPPAILRRQQSPPVEAPRPSQPPADHPKQPEVSSAVPAAAGPETDEPASESASNTPDDERGKAEPNSLSTQFICGFAAPEEVAIVPESDASIEFELEPLDLVTDEELAEDDAPPAAASAGAASAAVAAGWQLAGHSAGSREAPGQPSVAPFLPAAAVSSEPLPPPLATPPETQLTVVKRITKSFRENTPAWITSAVIHGVVLILLGTWILASQTESVLELDLGWAAPSEQLVEAPLDVQVEAPEEVDFQELTASDRVEVEDPAALPRLDVVIPDGLHLQMPDAPVIGNALMGRQEGMRRAMALAGGGNEASENAVALGLEWLKEHQMPDGSWHFDHTDCPRCQGKCGDRGRHESTTGATAMALLPFLGAGQTHKEGKYVDTVRKGVYHLVGEMQSRGKWAGDLQGEDGNLYCHGLAAITLCEAYAMTKDKGLRKPAQLSLDFISTAQDPRGGGWRYRPYQPGDTSVVGWQVMALKSGHMAYLKVPKETIAGANRFLDSVQSESGAFYGYMWPGRGSSATTAIGLLCRMYLGWKKDHPGIMRGVDYLSERGPSDHDMYYNYYATQVLHHYGGQKWKDWNVVMRDQLIATQDKEGHERGSWGGRDHHGSVGGRLYLTSLSIMTLEVYYRHMPIYGDESIKREF